jgi:hypothetical protein
VEEEPVPTATGTFTCHSRAIYSTSLHEEHPVHRRSQKQFMIRLLPLIATIISAACTWAETPPAFTPSGDMQAARVNHTATLLNDGRVLIAGGWNRGGVLAGAELFDPASATFTPLPNMTSPRQLHSATLLADGRVLIAGGLSGSGTASRLSSAELFDPVTATFSRTGDLNSTHFQHAATRLTDGTVLISGGYLGGSLEYYDPAAGSFVTVPGPAVKTDNASDEAVLLANGSVFLVGSDYPLIFNASTNSLKPAGYTPDLQSYPAATLLLNGKVLLSGNWIDDFGNCAAPCDGSQIFDPVANAFSRTAPPSSSRYAHTATLLADGTVLLAGGYTVGAGLAPAEIYDPSQDSYSQAGEMVTQRVFVASTLLADGRVLFTGGETAEGPSTVQFASTEIYTPAQRIAPPVLLSLSGDNKGPGAILHADTHMPVTDDNPASAGEPLEVYATGLAAQGAIPPSIAIGGHPAMILWFGTSPVYAGLNQINIRVPDNVATDKPAPVRLNYIGRPSNEVTMSVK